jgi:hypothetical protein
VAPRPRLGEDVPRFDAEGILDGIVPCAPRPPTPRKAGGPWLGCAP